MSADWVKIYSDVDQFAVQIRYNLLREAGLAALVMNKQDSMYGLFGDYELYVKQADVVKALYVIEERDERI